MKRSYEFRTFTTIATFAALMLSLSTGARSSLNVGKVDTALLAIYHPYLHGFNPVYRSVYRESVPWAGTLAKTVDHGRQERAQKLDELNEQIQRLKDEENELLRRKNDELRANTERFTQKISAASSSDPAEAYSIRETFRTTSMNIAGRYDPDIEDNRKKQLSVQQEINELSSIEGEHGSPEFLSARELETLFGRIENELVDAINAEAEAADIDFVVNTGFRIPLKFLAGISSIPFRPTPAMSSRSVDHLSAADETTTRSALYLLERFALLQVISNNLADSMGAITFNARRDVQELDITLPVLKRVLKAHDINEADIAAIVQDFSRVMISPSAASDSPGAYN